jgi:hypothetical protein
LEFLDKKAIRLENSEKKNRGEKRGREARGGEVERGEERG